MPNSIINKLVEECDLSPSRAEHLWKKAKEIAEDEGFSESSDSYYPYIVGVVKKMIGDDCREKLNWQPAEASTKNAFLGLSFGLGFDAVDLADTDVKKTQQLTLPQVSKESIPIDASFWLPLAAKHYCISGNLNDYILMPVPTIISEIPNTNGDSVSKEELLDFVPDLGMPAFKSFRGKPCLPGNTLISTEKGLIPISDIEKRKCKTVLTKDGTARIKHWAMTGYRKTLNVFTETGRLISATVNHPFLVLSPDCSYRWIDAGDLAEGDMLVVRLGSIRSKKSQRLFISAFEKVKAMYKEIHNGISPTGVSFTKLKFAKCNQLEIKNFPKQMTRDLAKVLGYLISEGHIRHNISFYNTDVDLVNDYISCFKRCFDYSPTVRKLERKGTFMGYESTKSYYTVKAGGKDFKLWFKEIGLTPVTSPFRTIPTCILEAKREHILKFLSAYIEGDGCLSGNRLQMYTTSFVLSQQLKLIIESLGYPVRIRKDNRITRKHGWYISVKEPFKLMQELDIISTKRKLVFKDNEKLEERKDNRKRIVTNSKRLPYVRDWATLTVRKHRTGYGPNMYYWDYLGNKLKMKISVSNGEQGKLISQEHTLKLANLMQHLNPEYKQRLNSLVGDFIFERITNITKNSVVEPVFDLQTTSEQFVANGIVVHNCFLEHANTDIKQAKGVILDVFLKPLKGFAGGKHAKLIKLLGFDKTKDPMLCKRIEDGAVNTVSMGMYYTSYSCSICNNSVGTSFGKICQHTKPRTRTYQDLASGKLVYRKCKSIRGFETSIVADPAYVNAIGVVLSRD